jgi:hypothetical protein
MKKISTFILCFAIAFSAASQVVLTYKNHAPVPGENPSFFEVDFVAPSEGGSNKVWDLSGYELPESFRESVFSTLVRNATPEILALAPNLVLEENDRTNYLIVNENVYGIAGFSNENYTVHYYQTFDRLVFPFAFGNSFTKPFTGKASYPNGSFVDFAGYATSEVDAEGYVLLPGDKVIPVVRVKQTVNSIQATACGSVDYQSTRYSLYAANERYPLITIIRHEHDYSNGCNRITEETFVNARIFTLEVEDETTPVEEIVQEANFSYSLFPNPFSTELKLNFTLHEQGRVNISLYDMQGRRVTSIVDNSNQPEGFYSYKLNAADHNLMPGVYFVRFEIGSKAQSERVIYIR